MTTTHECPICEGPAERVRERADVAFGKRTATVVVYRMRCVQCDEAFYLPDQMDVALALASAELRKAEQLLQGEEIRAVRKRLRLSQRQFEQLLGLGEKTVVRWERGIVFQNRATDLLIRLVGELPQAISLLSEWNGLSLPAGDLPRETGVSQQSKRREGSSRQSNRSRRSLADEPKVFPIESKMKDAPPTRVPVRGATDSGVPIDTTRILEAFK